MSNKPENEKSAAPSPEEIKRLASEKVAKIEAEQETQRLVDEEVKRQLAAKKETKRLAEEAVNTENKNKLLSEIRKKHGGTMRIVNNRYSADSKPLYIDKG